MRKTKNDRSNTKITFSAESHLIRMARLKAQKNNKSLNLMLREFLNQYVRQKSHVDLDKVRKSLPKLKISKSPSRDEMREK